MCELFGVSSKKDVALNKYLKEFFSHSVKHPDGWGISFMGDGEPLVEKEPLCALKSRYLTSYLSKPIIGKNMFAHIRYATIGNVEYNNCHPMVRQDAAGRWWTLIHNGTIFEFEPLHPYVRLQEGDTDSERILMYIVDCINSEETRLGHLLSGEERFRLLDEITVSMSEENKLNFLLYDGECMYSHTNYRDTLSYLKQDDTVIFSTLPLGTEEWKAVPFTTLLAWKDGKLLQEGTNHGHEYIDNPDNIKTLYQIFSNL